MKPNTRRLLQLGIGLVVAPPPELSTESFLRFQQEMIGAGVEYDRAERQNNNEMQLTRVGQRPLQVIARNRDQINQLMVVGGEPLLTIPMFTNDAEAVRRAYVRTWPFAQQVVASDVSLRCLYEVDADHAFRFLWESTLRQPSGTLAQFGRPILGGGLRFVMPNTGSDAQDAAVEVKIESFLQDTQKLFVETQFVWQVTPPVSAEDFDMEHRIAQVDQFITNQVVSFVMGGKREGISE